MSLRHTLGSTLVEVMVMMVILGMSIVGIYSMVNSGQKLASLTDTRLNALNIARDGLESVTTLRDTFAFNGYPSGVATTGEKAFFSTDGSMLTDTPALNYPKISDITTIYPYILTDTKTLTEISVGTNTAVCVNEFGWYSQVYSKKTAPTIACESLTTFCTSAVTQSCRTQFQRKITFTDCVVPTNSQYCVVATSKVWWGADENDATTSLTLSQTITPLD